MMDGSSYDTNCWLFFSAYLSILSDYKSVALWLQDADTAWNIVSMLNMFYDMKQINRPEVFLSRV